MMLLRFRATLRHFIIERAVKFLVGAIRQLYAWEIIMATQDECKHENQTGAYCNACGKQLRDPDDERVTGLIDSAIDRAFERHGIKKPATSGGGGNKGKTLADTLGLNKGKK